MLFLFARPLLLMFVTILLKPLSFEGNKERGGALIGAAEHLSRWRSRLKLRPFHLVAFESWDMKKP
nr:hypothetical protein [uncultured Cohaesibacter sp.]